jgi:hypothetical protein
MAKKKKTARKKTRKQGRKKLSPDLKERKRRDSGVLGKRPF